MSLYHSYNLKADAELVNTINDEHGTSGLIVARRGELFAKVPLGEWLSEDTNAGKKYCILLLDYG